MELQGKSHSAIKQELLAKRLQGKLKKPISVEPIEIAPQPRGGRQPLSYAEQRLWFLEQFEGGHAAYNIPIGFRLTGPLNPQALELTLKQIVQRHDILRASFHLEDGQPRKIIAERLSIVLPVNDLREKRAKEQQAEIERLVMQDARTPFHLAEVPLFRLRLFRLANKEYEFYLTIHHIIFDGWSFGVFLDELSGMYEAFLQGRPSPFPPLARQYADFIAWQQERMTGKAMQRQAAYWKQQLAGRLPTLDLPTDRPRPPMQTFAGALQTFELPDALAAALRDFARQEHVTLFTFLLTAFTVLLFRYTGQEDVIVGTPAANRATVDFEPLIGLFVNTLAMRSDLSGNPAFRDLLRRVQTMSHEALANQEMPFDLLVTELNPDRNTSHQAIFQVMFVLQNMPLEPLKLLGVSVEPITLHNGAARFDLLLEMIETDRVVKGVFEYNTDLFDAATIRRMAEHFLTLLHGIAANPNQPIAELPILPEAERRLMLVEWNATAAAYPLEKCLHQLIEEQAERTPDAVALIFDGQTMTYRELNQRANQLAHYLQRAGVAPEILVGVHLERSFDMIIGLLGILKAGGAYVPLDPAFPRERLLFMVEDAKMPVLLTQESLQTNLTGHQAQIVCIDAEWAEIAQCPASPPLSAVGSDCLCYILYTSGSTGKPKGVQISHRNVVNFLCSMQERPGIQETDALLAVTTLSFDIAGLELFLPLMTGARVILAKKEDTYDGGRLLDYLEHAGVTVMQATPVSWRLLIAAGWNGSSPLKVLCGGEAMPLDLKTELTARSGSVWNMYGPTETTIWSTLDVVKADDEKITIGRPIANTQMYILNDAGQPAPIGIPDELYIGGEGVSRGYWNRSELTQERFLPNPFLDAPNARLYRTGDVARYLPDGRIEFFGRADQQVKIRGFRIELGEIEAVLMQHPAVRQAVVVARGTDVPQLAAYLALHAEKTEPADELRAILKQNVPDYMIPTSFTILDELPLTPNGKVDRRALPEPENADSEMLTALTAPRNPREEQIAQIWQELLGVERIGIDHNFFHLGGHSLLAMQMAAKLSTALSIRMSVKDLFLSPTIAQLAKRFEAGEEQQEKSERTPCRIVLEQETSPIFEFESRPLLDLYAAGSLEPFTSAALDYFTTDFIAQIGLRAEEVMERWCHGLPTIYTIADTQWGRLAGIMLPMLDTELFSKPEELRRHLRSAMQLARLLDVRAVTLTGLLAWATDYGRDTLSILPAAGNFPPISTGHAVIASAYLLNIERILQESGRNMAQERVVCLDVSSLGLSTLRLMLHSLPHPSEIIVGDLYGRPELRQAIQAEFLNDLGFRGRLQFMSFQSGIPKELYDSTLFISPTNVPDILDAGMAQAGTLIVGVSCFRQKELLARFQAQEDLLFTVGGVLRLPSATRDLAYLPREMASHLHSEQLEAFNSKIDPHDMPACAFSAVLAARFDDICPTIGLVEGETVFQQSLFLKQSDCRGADLHIGRFRVPEASIRRFRERFGR